MIAYTVNHESMIQKLPGGTFGESPLELPLDLPLELIGELPEKKPLKRRILVSALLALAAFGAHRLHARFVPTAQPEVAVSRPLANDDVTALAGANSLLGDNVVDHKFDVPAASSSGAYELDWASTVNQAGLALATVPTIDGQDSLSLKQIDSAAGSSVPDGAALSAVPEPCTAGLFVLLAVPVIARRRPRNRGN